MQSSVVIPENAQPFESEEQERAFASSSFSFADNHSYQLEDEKMVGGEEGIVYRDSQKHLQPVYPSDAASWWQHYCPRQQHHQRQHEDQQDQHQQDQHQQDQCQRCCEESQADGSPRSIMWFADGVESEAPYERDLPLVVCCDGTHSNNDKQDDENCDCDDDVSSIYDILIQRSPSGLSTTTTAATTTATTTTADNIANKDRRCIFFRCQKKRSKSVDFYNKNMMLSSFQNEMAASLFCRRRWAFCQNSSDGASRPSPPLPPPPGCYTSSSSSDEDRQERKLRNRRFLCESSVRQLYEERKDHIEEIFSNTWLLSDELDDNIL